MIEVISTEDGRHIYKPKYKQNQRWSPISFGIQRINNIVSTYRRSPGVHRLIPFSPLWVHPKDSLSHVRDESKTHIAFTKERKWMFCAPCNFKTRKSKVYQTWTYVYYKETGTVYPSQAPGFTPRVFMWSVLLIILVF